MEQRTCSLGTFCDMWDPLTQQVYIVVSSMESFLNRHSLYVAVGWFFFFFFCPLHDFPFEIIFKNVESCRFLCNI